jgi:hypothetical protein
MARLGYGSARPRLGTAILVPARGFETGDIVGIGDVTFLLEVALSLREIGFPREHMPPFERIKK